MMTISAFFDESGKHNDHKVVSFGGVCSFNKEIADFSRDWGHLLHTNGLRELSAKNVFNPNVPLSSKNTDTGLDKRIRDLIPFVECIRKNIQVITGTAIDVRAYKKLPSHYFQVFGDDPVYTSFLRSLLRILEFTPDQERVVIVCDDEEKTALPFYKLYRRVRKVWPKAKTQLVALSFADDRYLYGLQAADLIASIIRLEVRRKLVRLPYVYQPLFEELKKPIDHKREAVWDLSIAMGTKENLRSLAEELKTEYEKALKISLETEIEQEMRRRKRSVPR